MFCFSFQGCRTFLNTLNQSQKEKQRYHNLHTNTGFTRPVWAKNIQAFIFYMPVVPHLCLIMCIISSVHVTFCDSWNLFVFNTFFSLWITFPNFSIWRECVSCTPKLYNKNIGHSKWAFILLLSLAWRKSLDFVNVHALLQMRFQKIPICDLTMSI